jgi:SRSO17 transposase
MTSRFAAVRVQPAHGHTQGEIREPVQWLLIEWPEGEAASAKYCRSTLPEQTPLRDLVWWAKLRWWIEQNYQPLKDELGLDHFEGRSWPGWHHHVTLTLVALAFLVLEMLRNKKTTGWTLPKTRQAVQAWLIRTLGHCPMCWRTFSEYDPGHVRRYRFLPFFLQISVCSGC